MADGKLYEVVDRPRERWTFLEPGTLLYLAAFADLAAAEAYGALNGYEVGSPIQVRGAAIDAAQPPMPPEPDIPAANSPIPDLRRLAPAKPPAAAPKPSISFGRRIPTP